MVQLIGTSPWLGSAIVLKAATDRSIEFALSQVGQSSATVTVTDLPLSVLFWRLEWVDSYANPLFTYSWP